MKKATTTVFLILLACLLSIESTIAQSYSLKSLDGEPAKITLYYKPFSGVLSVASLNEKFFIGGYGGIEKAEVVEEHFLKIIYASSGGSNSVVKNLLILCINKKKMFQAIHIDAYSGTYTAARYNVNAEIFTDSLKLYKLRLDITKYVNGRLGSVSKIYKNKSTNIVNFNLVSNCFSNTTTMFEKTYVIYDPKVRKQISRTILGKFPGVIIGGDLWSIIDNQWYSVNLKNRLMYKYSYK